MSHECFISVDTLELFSRCRKREGGGDSHVLDKVLFTVPEGLELCLKWLFFLCVCVFW